MKKNFVTLVTLCNLMMGVVAFILLGHGLFYGAVVAIFVGVLLDSVDGFLARKWGVASEFGAQLDTLADMVSFVAAGSGLAYYWCVLDSEIEWASLMVCLLFCMTGALRLARFQLAEEAPDRFEGLPTTAATFILCALCWYQPFDALSLKWIAVVILAWLMISPIRYRKLTYMVGEWSLPRKIISALLLLFCTKWALLVGIAGYLTTGIDRSPEVEKKP